MTEVEPVRDPLRIGIVGGGASGVLAARALARACPGARLAVIDPNPGRGVAYGGRDPAHLLNTRAANMSLDRTAPRGFLDWLAATRPLRSGLGPAGLRPPHGLRRLSRGRPQ